MNFELRQNGWGRAVIVCKAASGIYCRCLYSYVCTDSKSWTIPLSLGTFKWPDKALLYCLPPGIKCGAILIKNDFFLEQELLANRASRLVFQTYLHLSKLPFTVKTAANARNMSPDGSTPFVVFQIRNQPMIWTKFEQLVGFLRKQVWCRSWVVSFPSFHPSPSLLSPSLFSPSLHTFLALPRALV